ncbi:hypothetical protein [uncultured Aquitalea sp.]|uniref:hypothetical protein n=1 Tax=uncultured Aquitalea sp. TaxID=540272 RepID=UPI0025FDCE2C|nr:hypothetical protein [uncultured Aquitalea sp.]
MDKHAKTVIEDLIRIATGEIKHINRANCPTQGSVDDRQDDCPACQAIVRAEKFTNPQWKDAAQAFETVIRKLDIG